MQVKKPIVFHLPKLFVLKLDEELIINPPSFRYQKEYFYYLIRYLTVKEIQNKNSKYFAISLTNLKRVTVSNIDRYVIYLEKGAFLERDNYEVGVKAYHYKMNPEFLEGFVKFEISPTNKIYPKIIRALRLKQKNYNAKDKRPEYLRKMWLKFKTLDFDYEGARKWINKNPSISKKYSYHTALDRLEDKRFRYFKRNRTNNRLDSNLTNLPKGLKKFIKGDYKQIDLANSQPYLLGQFLGQTLISYNSNTNNINTKPLCSYLNKKNGFEKFVSQTVTAISKMPQKEGSFINGELLNFNSSCLSGNFYDDFLTRLNDENVKRDDVKKMMFAVLFSKNENKIGFKRAIPFEKEKKMFAEVYPEIFWIVEQLKKYNHRNLPISLQKMEAYVFIDYIALKLVEIGIVPLTIHDSILVPKNDADEALKVIESVFKELFGVVPTFHNELLKSIS